jgi:hypothetical protein
VQDALELELELEALLEDDEGHVKAGLHASAGKLCPGCNVIVVAEEHVEGNPGETGGITNTCENVQVGADVCCCDGC